MKAFILLAVLATAVSAESGSIQDASAAEVPGDESTEVLQPRWVNSYDQPLYFTCPSLQSVNSIISQHHNKHEDRVWDFTCKSTFTGSVSCQWSPYVNNFDEDISFACPFGSAISGFESYHHNKHEDRRWKFLCCHQNSDLNHDCLWTNYVNDFDAYFHWPVPSGRYLVGVYSYHDNHREDRRWKYQHCAKRP
ncbi:hemagglutinin/amebocyte aggregation factor-like [Ambystoma mexicanum]|uniref:hemagglutinin/amebocyte aggregation factor-like n=1 Tax=Ambystoma mexicanum TaxID=8296 RepID=UPI0037E8616A